MAQKKAELRVFVDGVTLKVIDDLIGTTYGNTRSEIVRTVIHDWITANIEKMKEWQRHRDEARAKGYLPKK